MGIFDIFRRSVPEKDSSEPPISAEEAIYYRPESYYTDYKPTVSGGKTKVISFEQRKQSSFPTKQGLYVAEVLLLYYCSLGTYPHPKNGYPGFWWFEYGIKNVGFRLSSLESRGFIKLNEKGKYFLTEKGEKELSDNEYVPYMHKAPDKTTEDRSFGPEFNVWSVNRQMQGCDASQWKKIVNEQIENRAAYFSSKRKEEKENPLSSRLKDPKLKAEAKKMEDELAAQDAQIELINEAEESYEQTKNIDDLIRFWESVWDSGGLLFNGSTKTFRLPDLYIKQRRYKDALRIVKKIKRQGKYTEKADGYIEKINKLMINDRKNK